MKEWLKQIRKGYGKKLISIHALNGWMVLVLSLSGLVLLSGYWRQILGAVRSWVKWLHIGVGLALLLSLLLYLILAAKHWKQLKNRPLQKLNVILILILLGGWLISGIILWQLRLAGPTWTNNALIVHDLLTWLGLPYIIYHSITRTKWLKEPNRRAIVAKAPEGLSEARTIYGRRSFLLCGPACTVV
ncbi:hypothetical protein D3C73_451280 [compost metagenome]